MNYNNVANLHVFLTNCKQNADFSQIFSKTLLFSPLDTKKLRRKTYDAANFIQILSKLPTWILLEVRILVLNELELL